jgi:hypothetical protein
MRWLGLLLLFNWIAWFAITIAIGGDAISGKTTNGHYYVSSHGVLTEVSAATFAFSRWHTYATWGSVAVCAICGFVEAEAEADAPGRNRGAVTLTMFGIANCDTVKKARTWLDGQGLAYTFHDYKKQGADADQVAGWVAQAGWRECSTRPEPRSASCPMPTRLTSRPKRPWR